MKVAAILFVGTLGREGGLAPERLAGTFLAYNIVILYRTVEIRGRPWELTRLTTEHEGRRHECRRGKRYARACSKYNLFCRHALVARLKPLERKDGDSISARYVVPGEHNV